MLTKELIANIAADTRLSKLKCEKLMNSMVDVIGRALESGMDVQLQGLGTLEKRETKAREVVNPKNGSRSIVPAGQKISFRPTANLKEELR